MFLLRQIPNLLTVSRFVAIPFMVFAILDADYYKALLIIIYIQAADFLDGNIARAFGWQSGFGAQMDPAADKTFLMTFWVTMFYTDLVPPWLPIVCVGRDVVNWLRSIIFFVYAHKTEVHVTALGKLTTTTQLASGIATLLVLQGADAHGYHGFWYELADSVLYPVYYLTVGVTLWSGLHYILRDIRNYGPGGAKREAPAPDDPEPA